MTIEKWVLVDLVSLVAVIFWLAGFGVGCDEDQAWVGWIVGAIPVAVVALSFMAIFGSLLVK